MYYYTTTIDEPGIFDVMADAVDRMNALVKKGHPFEIVRTEEPLDVELMPTVAVSRFDLTLTGDVVVKNERQAGDFVTAMMKAAEIVQGLNANNYIVIRPPRRGQPGI